MTSTYYLNGNPIIEKVNFPKGKIEIHLSDGRSLTCPLDKFPEIKKLSNSERKKYGTLAGMGLAFENSDEVYHISDFLGLHNTVGL